MATKQPKVQVVGGRKPEKKKARRKREVDPSAPKKQRRKKGDEAPEGESQSKYLQAALKEAEASKKAYNDTKPFSDLDIMKEDLVQHKKRLAELKANVQRDQNLISSYTKIVKDLSDEISTLESKPSRKSK